jgi:hypothetical protein
MKKILLLIFLFLFNCDTFNGELGGKNTFGKYRGVAFPVISTLFNARVLLLIKLTYATDSPLEWTELNNGTGLLYQDEFGVGQGLNPSPDLAGLPSAKDLNLFIDIGEVRISRQISCSDQGGFSCELSSLNSIQATRRFWDKIATERQVYCTTIYSFDDACKRTTGGTYRIATEFFFNGEGVKYPAVDPTAESIYNEYGVNTNVPVDNLLQTPFSRYYTSGIYVRNFVTGWGRENNALITTTRFDNNTIFTGGTNVVPRLNFNPGVTDAQKNSVLAPQLFPLLYSAGIGHQDFDIRPGFDPYILEIRSNLKENLMVHSYVTQNNTVQTMVGVSDWRKPHSGEQDMGGNLLTRARVIYPETAASLEITGGVRSLTHYYTIYRKDEIEFNNFLPLAATPVKGSVNKIKYMNPGQYRLRCVADLTRHSSRAGTDGFPETFVRETMFKVSSAYREKVTVNLACP